MARNKKEKTTNSSDAEPVVNGANEILHEVPLETVAEEETAGEEEAGLVESDRLSEEEKQEKIQFIVESLLFAADKPLSIQRLRELTRERKDERIIKATIDLQKAYASRGIVLHEVAGGFQFRTNPENSQWVQQLVAGRPVRLTRAQLEALAIIAYRQPATRPEIEEIRGVDCGAALKTLLDRGVIRVIGRKEEPGRPLLYGTTKQFLEFFNLSDLKELPTLREFSELTEESMGKVRELDEELEADGNARPGEDSDSNEMSPAEGVESETGDEDTPLALVDDAAGNETPDGEIDEQAGELVDEMLFDASTDQFASPASELNQDIALEPDSKKSGEVSDDS